MHNYGERRARSRRHTMFADHFHQNQLKKGAFKTLKLETRVAGNMHGERRLKEKIRANVD